MRRLSPLTFFAVLPLLLITAAAQAGTYYVATNGSNSTGDGSISNPWATITYAAQAGSVYSDLTAGRGATIYVRGGIYYGPVGVWVYGTSAGRLVIQAYPDEHPILDGSSNMGTTTDVVTVGVAYVDFIGFEIRNAPHVGYDAWGQSYGRILNNTIHDSQGDAIYVGHDTPGTAHDLLIQGNNIFHNCLSNSARNTSGGWPQAIGVGHSPYITVSYNRIYRNYGEGIIMGYTDNSSVVGNEVFDNYSNEIYLNYAQTTKVDGNFCYSYDPTFYRDYDGTGNWQPADGIVIANEHSSTSSTHTLANDDIINNVVLHAYWGIGYWRSDSGISTVRFANNTVYDATKNVVHFDEDSTATGIEFKNNIFALPSGSTATLTGSHTLANTWVTALPTTGMTYAYNLWTSDPGSPAHTTSTNDQIGSPGFVNATGRDVADFRVTSTSLAKDHGTTLSYNTVDYTRKTRSGTYDIGAYEC